MTETARADAAEHYRRIAAEIKAIAQRVTTPEICAELAILALPNSSSDWPRCII